MYQPARIVSFSEESARRRGSGRGAAGEAGRGTTVLIVDDERDTLEICALALRRAGYRVLLARDGEEALRIAGAELPALILMDLRLPVVDGAMAVEILKASPRTAAIPVLAHTIHDQARDYERARRAGFDGYVVKPCATRELVALVEKLAGPPAPASSRGADQQVAAD